MFAFSIGTLPALLSLSALSSFAGGGFQRYFLKFAGAAVVLLGLFNIQSGLTLAGIDRTVLVHADVLLREPNEARLQTAPIVDGKQIVDMKIVGYRYVPYQFAVLQGVPVEWRIDAQQAAGCGRILIAPKAGVRKLLPFGTTAITFTPQEPGDIGFNCSMGMMTRGAKDHRACEPEEQTSGGCARASNARRNASFFLRSARRGRTNLKRLSHQASGGAAGGVCRAAKTRAGGRSRAASRCGEGQHRRLSLVRRTRSCSATRKGDVTLVEFFDYNCGYCKRALSDMLALIKSDPKLRIVLKEFPVLGEASTEAAQVAVAVRMQDESGKKYLEFHQKLLGGRGQADRARALAAAKDAGVDMARLEKDMASPEVKATLAENIKLAENLNLTGTPSYVIGPDVVVGAVGIDALREKIIAARK